MKKKIMGKYSTISLKTENAFELNFIPFFNKF